MKTLLLAALGVLLALNSPAQQSPPPSPTTADPVAHFRSEYEMTIVRQILKLEVDLNNDGKKDILIGHIDRDPDTHVLTDPKEIGWRIYLNRGNGQYVLVPEKSEWGIDPSAVPHFDRDRYKVGWIPEINRYGLLRFVCGSTEDALCSLKAIVIEGETWKEVPVGTPVSAETHYDQFVQRFPKPPTPAVQEIAP